MSKSLHLVLLAVVVSSAVIAAPGKYKLADQRIVSFDRIGTTRGLSPGGVTAITQDHLGFIWIGTQEGLNRLDGYQIDNYFHEKNNSTSLLSDNIWSLLSDSKNRFWVGTDSGLNVYDFDTKSFEEIQVIDPALKKVAIFSLLEDQHGNIWIGHETGLSMLDPAGNLSQYHYDITLPSIGGGSVRTLYESNNGWIWVGSEKGGVSVYDHSSESFIDFPNPLGGTNVRAILEDDGQRIWFATLDDGLAIYDPNSDDWATRYFNNGVSDKGRSDRIRGLLQDREGSVWVGTDQGLYLWNARSGDFDRYVNDPTNRRSISDNTIVSLYQDDGGVIWAGTLDGVNKWNADVNTFPHYKQTVTNPRGVTSSSVTSFAESDDGDVWVGNVAGLNRWDSSIGELEIIYGNEIGLSDNRVMSLYAHGNELFVGTMAGGLNIVRDGKVRDIYQNDSNNPASISSNKISKIFKDSRDRIWIATYGGGVNEYLGNGRFRRFPDASNAHGAFSELRCTDIREASDGNLWVTTDGGGVVILDPNTGDTKNNSHLPSNANSIASDNLIALLMTDDAIWIGSRDSGLSRFDVESRDFTTFNKSHGLSADSVYGILEDDEGRIWISSGKGISVLDPITQKVVRYDSTHGLQSDDFHSNAYLKLRDGSMVFGGNNGFNAFRPHRISKNENTPPIRLTKFTKFNKEVNLPLAIDRTDLIELEHDDSVIGFEFSSLDYTAPEKNRYQFQLVGFNEDWVDNGTKRQVTYTNLDPGSYVFRVRGSNNDGVWNDEGTSLQVIVHPPMWATWWAYSIYALLFAVAIFLLMRANAMRMKRITEKRYAERLQLYIESLEEATDCVLIADQHVNLIYANDAIKQILGFSPGEALGEPLFNLLFRTEFERHEANKALEEEGRYHGEVNHVTDTGERHTTEVTIAAVKQLGGEQGSGYVSISRDVTDRKTTEAELENYRKNLEFLVAEQTGALKREVAENKAAQKSIAESLQEKELLLKEVHHRVKNNMQVISSLLNIQAETTGNEHFTTLLGESQQRIKSMSLIHENLYQSDSLLEIDFEDYIRMLANSLCRFYTVPGVNVLLDIDVQDVSLDIETAVPCGLIINELVSNSLKHAFNGGQTVGTIRIAFHRSDCGYVLRIRDDGSGLPHEFSLDNSTSMGMEIVSILTQQLDGSIRVAECDGAAFEITFPRNTEHV